MTEERNSSSLARVLDLLGRFLIRDFDRPHEQQVRVRYGYTAGWSSIIVLFLLFAVRLWLGLSAGAVSVVAVSFTLLSDLIAAIVLVASFRISGRPATARTPFGQGRMEQVAPLLISFVLFFLGIEILREAAHALIEGHEARYWSSLPWIVFATAVVKRGLGSFVLHLGRKADSQAIEETAAHLRIEGFYSLAVVTGLLVGHHFHLPWADGTVGLAGGVAILYLSYHNARHALVPLLGQAPPPELLERIRSIAGGFEGVSAVHEIIIHEYGRVRVISMHAEIPEALPPAEAHGVAEGLESALRRELGSDVVVHSDPLMTFSPEVAAVEEKLKEIIREFPEVRGYYDFRVVAHSAGRIIIIADVEVDRELSDAARDEIMDRLRTRVKAHFPNLAYSVLSLISRFSF